MNRVENIKTDPDKYSQLLTKAQKQFNGTGIIFTIKGRTSVHLYAKKLTST